MNTNGDQVCVTKRTRRPGPGFGLARMLILLASAALGSRSLAATAATDLEHLDARVARSAIPVGAFDKPKLPCVCQEGTTDDTLGAAGFLVRAEGSRFIEGVLQKAITVVCVVQGFDAAGALQNIHGCTVFTVLPR